MEMDMNMVFSILLELLVLRKDEDETTEIYSLVRCAVSMVVVLFNDEVEETGAYSSVSCAILMLLQLGLFGLSSITITVNSSSCSAMSMLLFLGLFALLSFLRRSEEEEAFTTNSLS